MSTDEQNFVSEQNPINLNFQSKMKKLTNKEQIIIHLISEGLTMKEIGEKLSISEQTVATHRKNIARKLGAENSANMVLKAIKAGYIKI